MLTLGLLCCTFECFADRSFPRDTTYVYDVWTSDQGLPQNSVTAIIQTGDGYIYAGTQEGLVRFNGSQFTVFDDESSPAFANSFVLSMLLDSKGAIWIGTESGAVLLRDGRPEPVMPFSQLSGLAVETIIEERAGVIWIGTREGVLFRLEDGHMRSILLAEVSNTSILCSCLDQQGRLWFGTNGAGLIRFEDGQPTLLTVADGLSSDQVSALLCDRSGRLLIGTADGSLMTYDGSDFHTIELAGISSRINTIFEDRQGRLWLTTHGQGIGRLDQDGLTVIDRNVGLANDVVLSIFEDLEGNLWVGTDGGGLNRLTESIFDVFDTSRGLSHDVIFPMLETDNGAMWIGTEGGGLNRIATDGSVIVVTSADGLADDKVFSLFEADDGGLWIGTYGGGLNYLVDGQITATLTTDDGLSSNFIWSLLVDSRGRLWIGTDGSGLDLYQNESFTNFSTRNGLSNNQVPVIHEAADGTIWVGTASGGLNRFDETEWVQLDSRHGLSSDKVLAIHEDQQGVLWIGTAGGGLNRYKDGHFAAIRKQDGLYDNLVYQILEDDLGFFWMSCNRGLFRARKADLDAFADGSSETVVCQAYGKAEGMKSTECNGATQPAGCRHSNGSLWFPTLKGAVVVDPRRVRERSIPPPVVIESLLADGKSIALSSQIVLPPGTRNIEIRYTGLSYIAPEKLQFRYRLQGYEEIWTNVGNRRAAYYTNLPPGDYLFQMTACNNDGLWNRSAASIAFTLSPHLYQKRWFQALGVLAIVATTLLLHLIRVRRLRRREEELSARVEAAMAEIKILSGLLPICASCKKIRDDKQRWQPIESYISDHSLAEFSHGLCPECAQSIFADVVEQSKQG